MSYRVVEFQPTPNPNAIKCILDRAIRSREEGPASYRAAAESHAEPLAAALFAVPGVSGLLINEDWITVNKDARSEWAPIKAEITKVLARVQ